MTLTEALATYEAEALPRDTTARHRIAIQRAYMAGALEAARMKPHDVIRECLDFARGIGREVTPNAPAKRAS